MYVIALLSPSGLVEGIYVVPVGTSDELLILLILFAIPKQPIEDMSTTGDTLGLLEYNCNEQSNDLALLISFASFIAEATILGALNHELSFSVIVCDEAFCV